MTKDKLDKKNAIWEASVVEQAVRNHYDSNVIGEITHASLIREGFNHNYIIQAKNKSKYVFRFYLQGKYYVEDQENGDDLRFELELLTFLQSKGLSVVEPIATKSGETLGSMAASTKSAKTNNTRETRFFALFHFAKGVALEERNSYLNRQQYFDLGKLVAQIHEAADEFETQHHRYHLNDQTYLLDASLDVIDLYSQQYDDDDMEDTTFFRPHAEELRSKVVVQSRLPKTKPTYGIIHADLHLGNIFFDDKDNTFTIIDFDHCAYGWRAYDIAPCTALGQTSCENVLEGYNSIRQLSDAERESFKTFNEMREIWDIGDLALFKPLWGEPVDKAFLEFANRRLHCLMGEASYCRPPLRIIAVHVTVNLTVMALFVWAFHKMLKTKGAWFRFLLSKLSDSFKRKHAKY